MREIQEKYKECLIASLKSTKTSLEAMKGLSECQLLEYFAQYAEESSMISEIIKSKGFEEACQEAEIRSLLNNQTTVLNEDYKLITELLEHLDVK